jgi:tetratricopeptide (TPR) repeat protein
VPPALAQKPDIKEWVGKRVVQRYNNFPLRLDGDAVLRSGTEVHIYRVARAEQGKLWLEGEQDGPSGWATPDQFIRVEEAPAYFSDRIRTHPDEVFYYVVRATLARDRKDHDAAIADWNKIVALEPDDARSYVGRGSIYLERKALDKAIADYSQAIRLDPDDPTWYYIRARAWQQKGERAKAMADFRAGVAIDPNFAWPRPDEGPAANELGDHAKAVDDFLRSLPLEHVSPNAVPMPATAKVREQGVVPASFDPVPAPKDVIDHAPAGLGGLSGAAAPGAPPEVSRDMFGVFEPQTAQEFIKRAADWLQIRQFDKAIVDCNQALELGSNDARVHLFRGLAFFDKKEYDKAIADHTAAIRLEPQNSFAYYARGTAYSVKGQYAKAVADLATSARLDPQNPSALNGLAWIWATCPDSKYRDGRRAIESATKACELTAWDESGIIDTLAAAHAEVGDFGSALKWQSKAIEIETDPKNADGYRARLKLYQAKMPYREVKP